MQEQPSFFLAVQATYSAVEVGLCRAQIIDSFIEIPTHHASKQLIPAISSLLSKEQIELKDLTYSIVSVGPAPFTTLRTVIATMQGLGYASGLPLVAVNGLEAFALSNRDKLSANELCLGEPQRDTACTHTFVLLHAFGQDVYHAQADHARGTVETGCCSFEAWLLFFAQFIKQNPAARIRFLGNGYAKHAQRFAELLGGPVCAYDAVPGYLPFADLVAAGMSQWESTGAVRQGLTPLYFKSYV